MSGKVFRDLAKAVKELQAQVEKVCSTPGVNLTRSRCREAVSATELQLQQDWHGHVKKEWPN